MFYTLMDTPIGSMLLIGDDGTLRGLYMQDAPNPVPVRSQWERSDAPFGSVLGQLAEYFDGQRTEFTVPLAAQGTGFQQTVWRALQDIPYGTTISYGELARRIGQPTASRAVGLANGRNPISVIVPCHRVIGANGTLTGYGGGLERKRVLLNLEAEVSLRQSHWL
jgi:methylated-DNA-[protein]-cysteine S-methyltransferase